VTTYHIDWAHKSYIASSFASSDPRLQPVIGPIALEDDATLFGSSTTEANDTLDPCLICLQSPSLCRCNFTASPPISSHHSHHTETQSQYLTASTASNSSALSLTTRSLPEKRRNSFSLQSSAKRNYFFSSPILPPHGSPSPPTTSLLNDLISTNPSHPKICFSSPSLTVSLPGQFVNLSIPFMVTDSI